MQAVIYSWYISTKKMLAFGSQTTNRYEQAIILSFVLAWSEILFFPESNKKIACFDTPQHTAERRLSLATTERHKAQMSKLSAEMETVSTACCAPQTAVVPSYQVFLRLCVGLCCPYTGRVETSH